MANRRWCLYGKITKSPGSHKCPIGLPVGTPIELRMERANQGRSQYVALECIGGNESPVQFETATIDTWHGQYGGVQRPCGCYCFAWLDRSAKDFQVGDTVEILIEPNDQKGWAAVIQGGTQ